MNFIIMLIVGGIAGWLASMLMKTDGQQGIFLNIVVGIIGGLLGGFLLPMVGLAIGGGTFSERSRELDAARSKPYYGTAIEKAARAFERYVHDRMTAKEIANDYLVNIRLDAEAIPTEAEMQGGIKRQRRLIPVEQPRHNRQMSG